MHVLDTVPGTLFMLRCSRLRWWGLESLWLLTATLGSSNVCSAKVFSLYLQYFLIGPTLGAKVCHQLLL